MTTSTVTQTDLEGLRLLNRGKVRDIYEVDDKLLIVTTDRISAFDHVLPTAIPDKGAVLTAMSERWFGLTQDIVPNHLITTDVDAMGDAVRRHADVLRGRTMLVKRAERIDAECVVRGYITGSGWVDYKRTGQICGIDIPAGMKEAEPFAQTLFTPATKADTGHDENISFAQLSDLVGAELAGRLRDLSIEVYSRGRDYAGDRGIILADTKFEFGWVDGELTLIDEMLTPDSSRFWDVAEYDVGLSPPSFDKQIVRNHLIEIGWDREPPIPALPEAIVERTAARYREIHQRLAT